MNPPIRLIVDFKDPDRQARHYPERPPPGPGLLPHHSQNAGVRIAGDHHPGPQLLRGLLQPRAHLHRHFPGQGHLHHRRPMGSTGTSGHQNRKQQEDYTLDRTDQEGAERWHLRFLMPGHWPRKRGSLAGPVVQNAGIAPLTVVCFDKAAYSNRVAVPCEKLQEVPSQQGESQC